MIYFNINKIKIETIIKNNILFIYFFIKNSFILYNSKVYIYIINKLYSTE